MNDPFGPALNKDGTEKQPTRENVIEKISGMRNDPRDRNSVIGILKVFGWALRYAPIMFRCDRECVECALKSHGRALEYAHPDLRDNIEVATLACEHDGMALPWVSERLRNDQKVLLVAVEHSGAALEFASLALRANKKVVLAAVRRDAQAFQCAPEGLRADKAFVMEVVKRNCRCIDFADPELRQDPDVIRAAFSRGLVLPGISRPRSPPLLLPSSPRAVLMLQRAPEAKLDRVFGGGGGPRPALRLVRSFTMPPGGPPRRQKRGQRSPRRTGGPLLAVR